MDYSFNQSRRTVIFGFVDRAGMFAAGHLIELYISTRVTGTRHEMTIAKRNVRLNSEGIRVESELDVSTTVSPTFRLS